MNTCPPCNHDCNEGRDCPARKRNEMTDLHTKAIKMALEFIVLASSKDRAWFTEKEFEVVAALRQALAQPEQEPVAWLNITDEGERYIQFAGSIKDFNEGTKFYTAPPRLEAAVSAEREACLKEIAIELDEWKQGIVTQKMIQDRVQKEIDELRQALAQPEQEPVAFMQEVYSPDSGPFYDFLHCDDAKNLPSTKNFISLYTAPTKREWIGLTEDEFELILEQHNEAFSIDVYISIEAKLKEKNNG